MSNDVGYGYAQERLASGLLIAADAAIGLGAGNRKEGDAALHARFINSLRIAEGAARIIAHDRGESGQGIAWVKLATRLHVMLDASTRGAAHSAFKTVAEVKGRGPHWIRFGTMLRMIADDCAKAAQRRSSEALIVGGREYIN
jgi:hypothetical protein